MPFHISIVGIPGSGKTTLVQLLESKLNYTTLPELLDQHLFHDDFAKDAKMWAFHNEVEFLTHLAETHHLASQSDKVICQDGSIYYAMHVFIKHIYEQTLLDSKEYTILNRLFLLFESYLPAPNLLIVTDCAPNTSLLRIMKRARQTDQDLGLDLHTLNSMKAKLDHWLVTWNRSPILVINTDLNNYNTNVTDIQTTVERIQKAVHESQKD